MLIVAVLGVKPTSRVISIEVCVLGVLLLLWEHVDIAGVVKGNLAIKVYIIAPLRPPLLVDQIPFWLPTTGQCLFVLFLANEAQDHSFLLFWCEVLTVGPTDGIGGGISTLHISPRLLIFIVELRMIRLKRELWTILRSVVEPRHAGAFGAF